MKQINSFSKAKLSGTYTSKLNKLTKKSTIANLFRNITIKKGKRYDIKSKQIYFMKDFKLKFTANYFDI